MEQPFLDAIKLTLGDAYTESIEEIYKLAIKFILQSLKDGFTTCDETGQVNSTAPMEPTEWSLAKLKTPERIANDFHHDESPWWLPYGKDEEEWCLPSFTTLAILFHTRNPSTEKRSGSKLSSCKIGSKMKWWRQRAFKTQIVLKPWSDYKRVKQNIVPRIEMHEVDITSRYGTDRFCDLFRMWHANLWRLTWITLAKDVQNLNGIVFCVCENWQLYYVIL